MSARFPLPSVVLFLTTAVAGVLCLVAVSYRDRTGARSLFGVLAAVAVWSAAYGMVLGTPSPTRRLFWDNVRFLGVTVFSVSLLVFAVQYAGRSHLVTAGRVRALAVVPALTNVVVWTNPAGLMRETVRVVSPEGALVRLGVDWGPWHGIHTVYTYLLVGTALVVLVEKALRYGQPRPVVRRTQAILLATAVPVVGHLATLSGVTDVDATPFGFALSALVLLSAAVLTGTGSRPGRWWSRSGS